MKIIVPYVNRISPNFTLLGEYVTMHTKTLIRCNKCKKEWSPTPTNFLRRIKCKFCENKTIKKDAIIPETVILLGEPCILYVIEISGDNDNCIKVGITTKDIKYRLANINCEIGKEYSARVLNTYIGDRRFISKLEKLILKELRYYKYDLGIKFNGDSELLATNSYNSIINIMEKHGYNI
jgi:hypothetical protein